MSFIHPVNNHISLNVGLLGPIPQVLLQLSSFVKNERESNQPLLNPERIKAIPMLENCSEEELSTILDKRIDSLATLYSQWIKNGKWISLVNSCNKVQNSHLIILKAYAEGLIDNPEDVATAFMFLDLGIRYQGKKWRIEKCQEESIPLNQRYSFTVKKCDLHSSHAVSEDLNNGEIAFDSYSTLFKRVIKLERDQIPKQSDWKTCFIYKLSDQQRMIDRFVKFQSDVGLTEPGKDVQIHGRSSDTSAVIFHDLAHYLLRCGIPEKEIQLASSLLLEISNCLKSMPEYSVGAVLEKDGAHYLTDKATNTDINRKILENVLESILDGFIVFIPELRNLDPHTYREVLLEKAVEELKLAHKYPINPGLLNSNEITLSHADDCYAQLWQKLPFHKKAEAVFYKFYRAFLCE